MPIVEEPTRSTNSTRTNFAVALLLHVVVLGGLAGSAYTFHTHGESWGDRADLSGAVQATMVNSIPLPPKVQPKDDNVLASESPSNAPPPPTAKAEPPPKPTDIPIVVKKPDKKEPPPKVADKAAPAPPKRPQPQKPEDKATSGETAGLRVAMTSVENKAGTSTTNITDSAFGQRYAFYVRQLTQKVSQQWFTQVLDSAAPGHRVYISFHVGRDGVPSDVTIARPSGDASLDASALRAVQRIDTFGPLPDGYSGNFINVQYYFEPKPQ